MNPRLLFCALLAAIALPSCTLPGATSYSYAPGAVQPSRSYQEVYLDIMMRENLRAYMQMKGKR